MLETTEPTGLRATGLGATEPARIRATEPTRLPPSSAIAVGITPPCPGVARNGPLQVAQADTSAATAAAPPLEPLAQSTAPLAALAPGMAATQSVPVASKPSTQPQLDAPKPASKPASLHPSAPQQQQQVPAAALQMESVQQVVAEDDWLYADLDDLY